MTSPPIDEAALESHHTTYDAVAFSAAALADHRSLAAVIDHTLLRPDASRAQVLKLCAEAVEYGFACAMVNPAWVATAYSALAGTGIPVGVVIGFPLGASLTTTKRDEAETMLRLGARELDMVLNVGLLKSGENALVEADIQGVVQIARDSGSLVKVILETCLLSLEEKLLASELAYSAGADFIKTSTGFSSGGATPGDVSLMRGVVGTRCGVKASGGIRTLADARAMLEAGASRIGASASVAIVEALDSPAK